MLLAAFGAFCLAVLPQDAPKPDGLALGRSLRDQGRFDDAIEAFSLVLTAGKDVPTRESAHFERADTYFRAARFEEAHQDYEGFLLRFPQTERLATAKRRLMESALELAKAGATGYLGIPTGSGLGIGHLRDALRRYPREEFSSDFAQKLGMFFYERAEYDKASEEFGRVLDQYGDSADAVLALYMLARCAEARFDAIDYDAKPLKEARRHYERFLDESEKLRRLPDPARGWVERLLPAVKERLSGVYVQLLAKRLQVAAYYEWKGLPKSARLTYAATLREDALFRKVLPSFPEMEAVQAARRRMAEIKP